MPSEINESRVNALQMDPPVRPLLLANTRVYLLPPVRVVQPMCWSRCGQNYGLCATDDTDARRLTKYRISGNVGVDPSVGPAHSKGDTLGVAAGATCGRWSKAGNAAAADLCTADLTFLGGQNGMHTMQANLVDWRMH